jgi:hypothetical protein
MNRTVLALAAEGETDSRSLARLSGPVRQTLGGLREKGCLAGCHTLSATRIAPKRDQKHYCSCGRHKSWTLSPVLRFPRMGAT